MAIMNTICPFCFNKVALTDLDCECLDGHTGTRGTAIEFIQQRVKCKSCNKDIIRFKCPRCNEELPKSILHTENLLFSIIGVSASGKTNYITVMLEELKRASNLQLALYSQNMNTRTHQGENYKVLYENHQKPPPTTPGVLTPPQIWGIKKLEQNFLQKLSKEVSAYTFIIYDGAGEDQEHIADNPSLCNYIKISKAIMVVIDPMILQSVKNSLSRDIYNKSTGGGSVSGDNDKNSIDIVNDLAEFIRKACGFRVGAQIKVPAAVVFTKMDALMDEFKNRTVSMSSPHVHSGYFDYSDAREVDRDIREWLSVKGEDAFINALKANFADFTFFGVSSYGDVPVSTSELNPIRPHRVLDPILWLFAKNYFIGANGMKFNKISTVFRGFCRFLSPQHYIKSKVILAALIMVLAIVVIVVANVGKITATSPIAATPVVVPEAAPLELEAATSAAPAKPAVTVTKKTPQQRYDEAMVFYNQKRYTAAVPIFREVADQGYAPAQYYLGLCYADGLGLAQDYGKAVEWYRKAADHGNALAQYNLGLCYADGLGLAQDYGKAAEWYRKAADHGNADAQYILGICYEYDLGLPHDIEKAKEWYRKSAAQGNEEAKKRLAELGG
ncbi:hypothetical protein AGMMS50293_03230 [Spirochaetia bacterium]|nr:hypothetical protein AGMMS50293_03230 [Spirochaetia bacterium]